MAIMMMRDKSYSTFEMEFGDEKRKQNSIDRFVKTLKKHRAIGAMMISEVWAARRKPGQTVESLFVMAPSERPDRAEALMIAVRTFEEAFCIIIYFTRDGKGNPIYEEPTRFDEGETRFFGDYFETGNTSGLHGNA